MDREDKKKKRRLWKAEAFTEYARHEAARCSEFARCVATSSHARAAACGDPQRCHELSGFLYHYHLRQWVGTHGFAREQLHVWSLEQFVAAPELVVRGIFAYLRLPLDGVPTAATLLRKHNPTASHPSMSALAESTLVNFFAADVRLLSLWLGDLGFAKRFAATA